MDKRMSSHKHKVTDMVTRVSSLSGRTSVQRWKVNYSILKPQQYLPKELSAPYWCTLDSVKPNCWMCIILPLVWFMTDSMWEMLNVSVFLSQCPSLDFREDIKQLNPSCNLQLNPLLGRGHSCLSLSFYTCFTPSISYIWLCPAPDSEVCSIMH